MRVEVDREKCMSIGYCVDEAPNTLALDPDQISIVIKQDGDPERDIVMAAKACPVHAITCWDDAGKQVYPDPDKGTTYGKAGVFEDAD